MTLLRRFAQSPSHQPGEALYEFMRMVGDDLLTHLHTVREQIAFAAAHVERWSIPHAGETIEAQVDEARNLARQVADALKYVGVLARRSRRFFFRARIRAATSQA